MGEGDSLIFVFDILKNYYGTIATRLPSIDFKKMDDLNKKLGQVLEANEKNEADEKIKKLKDLSKRANFYLPNYSKKEFDEEASDFLTDLNVLLEQKEDYIGDKIHSLNKFSEKVENYITIYKELLTFEIGENNTKKSVEEEKQNKIDLQEKLD